MGQGIVMMIVDFFIYTALGWCVAACGEMHFPIGEPSGRLVYPQAHRYAFPCWRAHLTNLYPHAR